MHSGPSGFENSQDSRTPRTFMAWIWQMGESSINQEIRSFRRRVPQRAFRPRSNQIKFDAGPSRFRPVLPTSSLASERHSFQPTRPPCMHPHQQCDVNYRKIRRATVWSYEFHRRIDGRVPPAEVTRPYAKLSIPTDHAIVHITLLVAVRRHYP